MNRKKRTQTECLVLCSLFFFSSLYFIASIRIVWRWSHNINWIQLSFDSLWACLETINKNETERKKYTQSHTYTLTHVAYKVLQKSKLSGYMVCVYVKQVLGLFDTNYFAHSRDKDRNRAIVRMRSKENEQIWEWFEYMRIRTTWNHNHILPYTICQEAKHLICNRVSFFWSICYWSKDHKISKNCSSYLNQNTQTSNIHPEREMWMSNEPEEKVLVWYLA